MEHFVTTLTSKMNDMFLSYLFCHSSCRLLTTLNRSHVCFKKIPCFRSNSLKYLLIIRAPRICHTTNSHSVHCKLHSMHNMLKCSIRHSAFGIRHSRLLEPFKLLHQKSTLPLCTIPFTSTIISMVINLVSLLLPLNFSTFCMVKFQETISINLFRVNLVVCFEIPIFATNFFQFRNLSQIFSSNKKAFKRIFRYPNEFFMQYIELIFKKSSV